LYTFRAMSSRTPVCSVFHKAIELIGGRWTGAVISVLLKDRARFAELRAAIPDITDRMLTDRLHSLEHEGIVERDVVAVTPVRVEYALTEKGRALAHAIEAIGDWAHTWSAVQPPAGETESKRVGAKKKLPPKKGAIGSRKTPDRAGLNRRVR
jgi:DNA-binding HxlR family transcriptional regulator